MKNQILKLLKNKFLKNYSFLLSGTIVSSILGFINAGLLIKAIGLHNNGIIFIALSYANFFDALINFQTFEGIIKFLPKYMPEKKKEIKKIIKQALALDIITAILAFILAFVFLKKSSEYLKWTSEEVYVIRILVFIILFNITGAFTGVLRIYEKFKWITFLNIIKPISNLILYLIGILISGDIIYYAKATVVTSVIYFIYSAYFYRKTLKENNLDKINIFNIKFEKEFLKFSIYTNLSRTINIPVYNLVPFIINKYLGLADVTVYKMMEKLGGLAKIICNNLIQVYIPEISKNIQKGKIQISFKIGSKIGIRILLLSIVGILSFEGTKSFWLFYLIPNYESYIFSIYFYFIFIAFTQIFIAQHPIFIYLGYIEESTKIVLVTNVIYTVLLVNLTKEIGLNGVILSLFIQAAIIFTSKHLILKRDELITK